MKKIKLLALTLAFCLIASVIPAPVAYAAETDYPEVVDLIYSYTDATETAVTSGKLYSTDANLPTVEANGFAIDFTNTVLATTYVDFNEEGIQPRIHGTGGKVTINAKTPTAGNYAVFVAKKKSNTALGQADISVKVGNGSSVAVDADQVTAAKIGEITVTGQEEYITITIYNGEAKNNSLYLGSFIFVPISDIVYAEFYNSNETSYIAASTALQNLKYEVNGLEYVASSLDSNDRAQIKSDNLYFRTKANDYITFSVLVTQDGAYNGVVKAIKKSSYYGELDIYVDGECVGSINSKADSAAEAVSADFAFNDSVELTAGLHEIKFVGKAVGDQTTVYNSLQAITLTKLETVEITEKAKFGDVSAYITKTEDNKLYFTAFSGIDSTEYSEVGFIINGAYVPVTDNAVYKKVTVSYDNNTQSMDMIPSSFFKSGAPETSYVFYSTKDLGVDFTGKVTFQPYAVEVGKTQADAILGYEYSVTLS